MTSDELSAISDELGLIKQQAYEQGRQSAIDDVNRQIDSVHREQERVGKLRGEWTNMVTLVQNHLANMGRQKFEYAESQVNSPYQFRSHDDLFREMKDPEEFSTEVARLVKMGRDFEFLLEHIKTNEIMKSQWDRLLVAMRLLDNK